MIKENIVTLKETTYQKPTELYAVVEKCVICGQRHIHSSSEGHRVAHCIGLGSRSYKLAIDCDNPENIRLAKKYGIPLEKGAGDN